MTAPAARPALLALLLAAAGCASAPDAAPADAAPADAAPAARTKAERTALAFDAFLHSWADNPAAERIPYALSLLDGVAAVSGEERINAATMMPLAAFFAHVFHDHPDCLPDWSRRIAAIKSPSMREIVVLALYLADRAEARAAVEAFHPAAPDGSHPYYAFPPPRLDALIEGDLTAPAQLDYCWGAYLATGDLAYALRVFEVAVTPSEERIDGQTAFSPTVAAARWSCHTFMRTDAKVRDAVNERLSIVPDEMLRDFAQGLSKEMLEKTLSPALRTRLKAAAQR